jgi:hypothetical protein
MRAGIGAATTLSVAREPHHDRIDVGPSSLALIRSRSPVISMSIAHSDTSQPRMYRWLVSVFVHINQKLKHKTQNRKRPGQRTGQQSANLVKRDEKATEETRQPAA